MTMLNQPFDSADLDRATIPAPPEPEWFTEPDNEVSYLESKLLACPFCRGRAELQTPMNGSWQVACLSCGASSRSSTVMIYVVELWNGRDPRA